MDLVTRVTGLLLLPPHLARPQNFPLHMLVTCNEEWSPWSGCKVYGASLAALAYVAEKHGYRAVHVMASGLDVFFMREDLLAALCWSFPPLSSLAHGKLPPANHGMHGPCTTHETSRLVDYLHYSRRDVNASAHAVAGYLAELATTYGVHFSSPAPYHYAGAGAGGAWDDYHDMRGGGGEGGEPGDGRHYDDEDDAEVGGGGSGGGGASGDGVYLGGEGPQAGQPGLQWSAHES